MSFTTTTTTTSLYQQILKTTRSVQTDLLAVVEMYHHISEGAAHHYIRDFRVMMDEDVLKQIEFVWTGHASSVVLDALRYKVEYGEAVRPNDRPGGLSYNPQLVLADFGIRITNNERWKNLSSDTREQINKKLYFSWSAASALDYSGGTFVADRTYGQSLVGIPRQRFVRR